MQFILIYYYLMFCGMNIERWKHHVYMSHIAQLSESSNQLLVNNQVITKIN